MAAPAKFLFDMDFSDKGRERPSTPSEIAAATNNQKAKSICPEAIAQTTTGTRRKRPMVMALGRFTL